MRIAEKLNLQRDRRDTPFPKSGQSRKSTRLNGFVVVVERSANLCTTSSCVSLIQTENQSGISPNGVSEIMKRSVGLRRELPKSRRFTYSTFPPTAESPELQDLILSISRCVLILSVMNFSRVNGSSGLT